MTRAARRGLPEEVPGELGSQGPFGRAAQSENGGADFADGQFQGVFFHLGAAI